VRLPQRPHPAGCGPEHGNRQRTGARAGGWPSRVKAVNRAQTAFQVMDVERLIEADHPARAIWELTGRLDLSGFYDPIEAVEGSAGRTAWDPRLLISLWAYAYSRGIRSARSLSVVVIMSRRFNGCADWKGSTTTRCRTFGWHTMGVCGSYLHNSWGCSAPKAGDVGATDAGWDQGQSAGRPE